MARGNIEGTVEFDGLIEGRLPADFGHEIEPKLRQWAAFARQAGVTFTLEIDGATFSLLVDSQPIAAEALGADPAATVKDLLEQLLKVFPPPHRTGVFSTLRSSEFRPGTEVQTIYAVAPPGRIEIQERQVDAETRPPDAPLTTGERLKLGAIGLLVAALVLLAGSWVIDYGALWNQVRNTVRPIETENIEVRTGPFKPLLSVTAMETGTVRGRFCLILTVEPAADFPATEAALNERWQAAETLQEKLAIEALARGYVRIEQYDEAGRLIAASEAPLAGLGEGKAFTLPVPITRKTRPAVVRFRY